MNKNYERGVRFKREVQQIFEEKGFETMRTAGSHSPFDIVLIKKSSQLNKIVYVAFVQCKTHKVKSHQRRREGDKD